MTNKDSIQQKHLEAIGDVTADTGNWGEYGGINIESKKDAATSCTTVTADAIGEAMEWIFNCGFVYKEVAGCWLKPFSDKTSTTAELVQLFLNQKEKI